MSTNDQTPYPTPVEATIDPTPAAAAPPAPVTAAPHGHPHYPRNARAAAVAVMIVGALVFATLAFGAGFAVRGAVDRHLGRDGAGIQRGYGQGFGMMGQGQRFGKGRGSDQGRGGMMRGYRGQGGGWKGIPQGGQGVVPNNGSVPSTTP